MASVLHRHGQQLPALFWLTWRCRRVPHCISWAPYVVQIGAEASGTCCSSAFRHLELACVQAHHTIVGSQPDDGMPVRYAWSAKPVFSIPWQHFLQRSGSSCIWHNVWQSNEVNHKTYCSLSDTKKHIRHSPVMPVRLVSLVQMVSLMEMLMWNSRMPGLQRTMLLQIANHTIQTLLLNMSERWPQWCIVNGILLMEYCKSTHGCLWKRNGLLASFMLRGLNLRRREFGAGEREVCFWLEPAAVVRCVVTGVKSDRRGSWHQYSVWHCMAYIVLMCR